MNKYQQQSQREPVLREFSLSEGLFLVKFNYGDKGVF